MPRKSIAQRPARWLLASLLLTLACRPKTPTAEQLAPSAEPAPAPTVASKSGAGSMNQQNDEVSRPEPLPSGRPLDVATVAGSPAAGSSSAARVSRPHRLLVVGDSLSDPRVGGGRYLATILAACPGSSLKNLARGGFMVNQMRRRFEAEALAELPGDFTELLVFGGVNDLYSDETAGRSVAKIQDDLGALYSAAKRRGLRVIALTVAPWGGFSRYFTRRRAETTRELNAWVRSRPGEGQVDIVVDAYRILACGDPERLCPRYTAPFNDGLHFGPEGHAHLADALLAEAFPECARPALRPALE